MKKSVRRGLVLVIGAAGLAAFATGCGDGSEVCRNFICPGGGGSGGGQDGGVEPDGSITLPDSGPPDDGGGPPPCMDFAFPFSQTQDVFNAPENAKWMQIKAWGAGGNQEKTCNGGIGGYSQAVYAVEPNQPLIVIVGGAGSAGQMFDFRFGWGNSGGGGLSGVFLGSDPVDENSWDRALVIAGGGGGDGVEKGGGPCITAIGGNHPQAGGAPNMMGTIGLDSGVNGGGGGYRGGLGGPKGAAGTGGTGFPDPGAATKPAGWVDSLISYPNVGDAKPPNANDPEYDGVAGQTESNGQVIIHFKCEKPIIEPPK